MRQILTLLTFALMSLVSTACSCFGPNTFCGVLNPPYEEPQWWIPGAVVMVVPLEQHYYGMDVLVVQTFQGEMNNDTVRVWGDNGALCRLYAGWNPGDTLIMGLSLTDLSGNTIFNPEYPPDLESPEDYMISGCGVYLLDYENGQVEGWIDQPEQQSMSLSDFEAMVESCTLMSGFGNGPQVDPIIVRTVNGNATIEWPRAGQQLDMALYDAQGRAVLRRQWDGAALMLDGLTPGAYVIEILRAGERFVRKMAVM